MDDRYAVGVHINTVSPAGHGVQSDLGAVVGHYHRIVNLTQHAVIEPTDTGVLDKLVEFGTSSGSAMAAVWLLLAREAWCGDRIAVLGYEGRPGDLAPDVVTETRLDGTAYYDRSLSAAGHLARHVLGERGICSFFSRPYHGVDLWYAEQAPDVKASGIEVVAVNLDKIERLDPASLGDSRDLHLVAANGGLGGSTTALTFLLAASNRGGGRGGGDFRSRHPLVGSWAGDHIAVLPIPLADRYTDITVPVREALRSAGAGSYEVSSAGVTRSLPPRAAPVERKDDGFASTRDN